MSFKIILLESPYLSETNELILNVLNCQLSVFPPQNWDWFRIDHLPAHKKDLNSKTHFNLAANAFFMVIPFIK